MKRNPPPHMASRPELSPSSPGFGRQMVDQVQALLLFTRQKLRGAKKRRDEAMKQNQAHMKGKAALPPTLLVPPSDGPEGSSSDLNAPPTPDWADKDRWSANVSFSTSTSSIDGSHSEDFPPFIPPSNFGLRSWSEEPEEYIPWSNSTYATAHESFTEHQSVEEKEPSPQDCADDLQRTLDSGSLDTRPDMRRQCLHELKDLLKLHKVLPSSMCCRGLHVDFNNACGEGGFATVHKGAYKNMTVAVKVLRHNMSDAKAIWESCAKEALLWKQLEHRNILPCFGVNRETKLQGRTQICLVSPWMRHGDLRHFLDAHPSHNRFQSLVDVLCGIQYLHLHNPPIVHADIRGHNILVMDDGHCCISDFGLSFLTEFSLTSQPRGPPGSTRWMAPEVLMGDKRVKYDTPARDMYAFGCTIVEIFASQNPYWWLNDHGVPTAVFVRHEEPWQQWPGQNVIPHELWKLARSCWGSDPAHRPTASQLLDQFMRLQE